ncbi:LysR family transcriptional regulator [Neobacillus sp. PS3-34]|uniref:LysR family transcriptional regulator n=1 Tax=Neobacillus sp. PS3-34 TaxID=3070678 RepID=UPI0027E1C73B|nr:LysR family transcriptional regulator [Neobacillus sp. PS3-34]WML50411.1 LysR family transcriptional regulator [Neobacillus sp. PS3-34]
MDIRQLSYFLEVARSKSFTKASQEIHLSQPTLSKMVKSLEEELDVILFDRGARQIELTDAGKIVYEQAKKILNGLNDLSVSLYDLMNLKKGKVTIGLPPVIGTLFFPGILADYHELYPEIVIQLVEDGARKIEQKVIDGEVDFGVVVLPVDEEKFEAVPFIEEEMMLLANASHPAADKSEVSLSELSKDNFILFTKEFALHQLMREECIRAGFEPHIAYESSQWDFMAEMVAKNLGVTFFPKSICERVKGGNIQTVSLTHYIPWKVGVILAKNRYIPYAVREFITLIQSRSYQPQSSAFFRKEN